jgi:hypothetical protein
MRKILLTACLAAAILAVWAVSAFACIYQGPTVCAPPDKANYHSAPTQQRASLPSNKGTNKAANQSPAINYGCFNQTG